MFSQQHYKALAKVLKETRQQISAEKDNDQDALIQHNAKMEAIGEFQLRLMELLKRDNKKFKELLFIGAASEHSPETSARR